MTWPLSAALYSFSSREGDECCLQGARKCRKAAGSPHHHDSPLIGVTATVNRVLHYVDFWVTHSPTVLLVVVLTNFSLQCHCHQIAFSNLGSLTEMRFFVLFFPSFLCVFCLFVSDRNVFGKALVWFLLDTSLCCEDVYHVVRENRLIPLPAPEQFPGPQSPTLLAWGHCQVAGG